MDLASKNGDLLLLQQLALSQDSYTSDAMDLASANGHVEILEWWKQSGLELKYTQNAMDSASHNGHTAVLDWWVNSGLRLLYYPLLLDKATIDCRLEVMEWWRTQNKIRYSYSKLAFETALKYWNEDWNEFSFKKETIREDKRIAMWWFNSGLELRYSLKSGICTSIFSKASKNGDIALLALLCEHRIDCGNYKYSLIKLFEHDHLFVINHFIKKNLMKTLSKFSLKN